MAKKPRVRVTEENIAKARKKIKETPKRGRWPRFTDIHKCDLSDYIMCFKAPELVVYHEKYKNACFMRIQESWGQIVLVKDKWHPEPTREVKTLATVRFYCESWSPDSATPLIDTECMYRCERISCPYYKKGFITETLKNKTFAEDVKLETNKQHNIKQEIE